MKDVFGLPYNNMNKRLKIVALVLLTTVKASVGEACTSGPDGEKCTYIVNHAFCEATLPAEELELKQTLEEVHTYAELERDPGLNLPDSITICSTIMLTDCLSYSPPILFNILNNQTEQKVAPYLRAHLSSRLGIWSTYSLSDILGMIPPTFPNQWTRSCMAINSTSGSVNWVVEGVLVMSMESEKLKQSLKLPKDLSRKLILGAISWGGQWKSVSNKVTNLNIFSSPLPVEEMKNMTEGENCAKKGNYLAWENMEWILHGKARLETVNINEPCERPPLANIFLAPFPGWDSCMHLCENLGSRAPSVTTREDWTNLETFLRQKIYKRGSSNLDIWLPLTDKETEGVWKDYSGNTIQNYTLPWIGEGPDGGVNQNCARVAGHGIWGDVECDWPNYACMCSYKPNHYLKLRGLCSSSSIEVFFKPMNELADFRKLYLQGLKGSSITYNQAKKIWVLNVAQSNVSATSKSPHASFTLGKRNWTITGDENCGTGAEYVTELKMSGCRDGEFTCNDGQCVSMNERCNQLPNCRDESDERNCQILVLKEGYNMEVPPIETKDPVNVSVSIDVLKLVDIDEEDYSIEIQFEISMKWKENRATYHNLKRKDSLNALQKKDFEKLWLPEVIYENTDQKESTRLGEFGAGEWETRVVVKRVGEPTTSGFNTVDETEVFEGSENTLVFSQFYTHPFQCNFQLATYPFDTQVQGILVTVALVGCDSFFLFW